jgi:hypothetical protein
MGDPDESRVEDSPQARPAKKGIVGRFFSRIRLSRQLARELRTSQEFWRERDPEENERGRLPDGEEIHLAGVWVAELFLPSTVDQLTRGIQSLGWSRGRTRSDDDLAEWVKSSRSRGGGWISLGLVSPPDSPHFMSERLAELPPGVRAALPYLHSVSSAMTALVILFILDDDAATGLTPILRASYETRLEATPPWLGRSGAIMRLLKRIGWRLFRKWSLARSHSIHRPHDLRRTAAAQYLRERRQECTDWVGEHLPGAFSSGLAGFELPTAQLLTTEVAEPLSEAMDESREAYDATGLAGSYRSWRADEWPAIRLALPDTFFDDSSRALTFACRRADSFDPKTAHIPDQSDWSIAQYADDRIRGLLIRWAASMLLAEHRRRLATVRDLMGAGSQRHSAVGNLKRARRLIAVEAVDVEVTAAEVKHLASNESLYRHDVLEPVEAYPIGRGGGGEPVKLLESLRRRQIEEADELTEQLQILVGALASSSSITAAISSVRLQRLVLLLTAVSIAIATWAAVRAAGVDTSEPSPRPSISTTARP